MRDGGSIAIRGDNLVKVFGPDAKAALKLLEQGRSKQDILEATRSTVAVRGISFQVMSGEIFVIMGLSGSGKSTVIRLLNRLIQPTAGTVSIDGENLNTLPARALRDLRNRKISMVFQHFAIFPHRTVRENVIYGLHLRGRIGKSERLRTEWALECVNLAGRGDAYPAELSGGMKQRVGIARALATDAKVMLMDEPFSALDPLIRREMQDLLLRLHHDLGRTIVFVTHDLNEAMRLGDRIMLMHDGAVAQLAAGTDMLAAPADEYVARFVAEADRTRIVSARDIMRPAPLVASIRDGLRAIADTLGHSGAEIVYILDDGRLIGTASSEEIASALHGGATRLTGPMLRTIFSGVAPHTRLIDLCRLSRDSALPLVVLDEDRRLLGVIPADALIAAVGRPKS